MIQKLALYRSRAIANKISSHKTALFLRQLPYRQSMWLLESSSNHIDDSCDSQFLPAATCLEYRVAGPYISLFKYKKR